MDKHNLTRMDEKFIWSILNEDLIGADRYLYGGADINVLDGAALRVAVEYDKPDIVEFLVQRGADINVWEDYPYRIARKYNYVSILNILKKVKNEEQAYN